MSKALQLYPLVYPDDPDPSTFKAGTGWLIKAIKDRHGVRALSVQGESLSAAADSAEPLKKTLSKIMEEKSLTLNQVFKVSSFLYTNQRILDASNTLTSMISLSITMLKKFLDGFNHLQ